MTETIGPYSFTQDRRLSQDSSQKITADTLLLSEFVLPLLIEDKEASVIELGIATGAIAFALCAKSSVEKFTGVEVNKDAFDIFAANIEANSLGSRIEAVNSDWRELYDLYPRGTFGVVVCNPPYMKRGEGRVSPNPARAMARSETLGELRDLVDISAYLAGDSGSICYVFPIKRREELIEELKRVGFEVERMEEVDGGKLFLVEARGR